MGLRAPAMLSNTPRSAELTGSNLRLQTAVRLRWFGVVGQLVTVGFVYLVLDFPLPFGICLAFIALSAWLNVFLRIRYPARHRLSLVFATTLLAYDIAQLAGLLYLTGGGGDPVALPLGAPAPGSAATPPPRNPILLGVLAAAASLALVFCHYPLPWHTDAQFSLPTVYKLGLLASVVSGMLFLALYAWRLSKEAREMSAALAATEQILAHEQQLHALDGLAAAAAHELGTPLSTISLVARELVREIPADSPMADDLALLQSQALRCRDILSKLTRRPSERDPLYSRLSVIQLVEEAAEPYKALRAKVSMRFEPAAGLDGPLGQPPVGERRPGVIYGIGNLVENAVDFARENVVIAATWSDAEVVLTIEDDGPGFPPDVMDTLGEPYITTRAAARSDGGSSEASGLGLGFFIAKTLLERSGAVVTLGNRPYPARGAIVRIVWPRSTFESDDTTPGAVASGANSAAPAGRGFAMFRFLSP